MTAPKGHEKERQSLGLSMRKFLLGTTANNPVPTDSANKPQYLGQTTMRDGASNPQEKADIAAPKPKKDYMQVKGRIRNERESENKSEQKVCQDVRLCLD